MQNKSEYWVYAIESEVPGRIHIGQTSDLDDRLKRHNSGEAYSTKAQRPWILVAYEEFSSRSKVKWKESELKKSKGKRLKWIKENKLNEPTHRPVRPTGWKRPRRAGHIQSNTQQQAIG